MFQSRLFILALLTAVAAVEIQQHSSVSVATHATSLTHALKTKRARAKSSEIGGALRGVAVEEEEVDDENDDDTDDSDDPDKEQSAKADEKKKEVGNAAMTVAVIKQKQKQRELEYFKDESGFDARVSAETTLITNETQSPALAGFLGSLRTEMRQYAMPSYPQYLQGELDEANKKVTELEAELGTKKATAKKVEAQEVKIDPKEASKPKKAAKVEAKVDGAETAAQADAKAVAQAAGETWAISFFANVALLAVVFAMASAQDPVVKNYTWFLIDQVVAIFLAVMYFNAFDSLLDFHSLGVQSAVVASVAHAVVMLGIVLAAAIMLRKRKVSLAILCGAGAHIVSFSSIHAAAGAQNHFIGMSYTYSMCVFGICTLGLAVGLIGFLVYTAKKRMNLTEEDDFMDKTDDLENDFGAMAFSVVFTMFMRFILTGHHPVDDETEMDHTQEQRTAMFFYAIACLIVAGFVVSFCSKKAADANATYAMKRVMNFLSTVATMNVAWAFLYWGEWQFFEALFPGEAIKGRVMFAITMTIVGCCGIIGLSKLKTDAKSEKTKQVALTALGLVVAWSWELCFDAAIEDMCEGVAHPVAWKVGSTLALAAIVLPVYAWYIKPITTKAQEALEA